MVANENRVNDLGENIKRLMGPPSIGDSLRLLSPHVIFQFLPYDLS